MGQGVGEVQLHASCMEVVAVARVQWVWWCGLSAAGFRGFVIRSHVSNTNIGKHTACQTYKAAILRLISLLVINPLHIFRQTRLFIPGCVQASNGHTK